MKRYLITATKSNGEVVEIAYRHYNGMMTPERYAEYLLSDELLGYVEVKWVEYKSKTKVTVTNDGRHYIMVDGRVRGRIHLCCADNKKMRFWAISCVSGLGFDTFAQARDYAKTCVNYK